MVMNRAQTIERYKPGLLISEFKEQMQLIRATNQFKLDASE